VTEPSRQLATATVSRQLWIDPPETVSLDDNEVHVWRSELDLSKAESTILARTLALDEQERAARFRFTRDRERFIVARGLLRNILARYLDQNPAKLQFCYGPFGKPALASSSRVDGLRFNVSHSHGFALYAVSLHRELGIDLECARTDFPLESIAKRFFSPEENDALYSVPRMLKFEAFLNCWTRKEAIVKARGGGLSLRFDRFSVSLMPGEPVALLKAEDNSEEASRWRLEQLAPWPDCVAALAVEGRNWQLKCWQWSE
jgi:4'-phosphopantetheinyl transferase